MLNLDTHIVVSLLNGDLSKIERDIVLGDSLSISDIVLWELAKLVQIGRLELNFEDEAYVDLKSDPAGEIIAATSIVEKVPLLTRDRRILKSKLVPFPL